MVDSSQLKVTLDYFKLLGEDKKAGDISVLAAAATSGSDFFLTDYSKRAWHIIFSPSTDRVIATRDSYVLEFCNFSSAPINRISSITHPSLLLAHLSDNCLAKLSPTSLVAGDYLREYNDYCNSALLVVWKAARATKTVLEYAATKKRLEEGQTLDFSSDAPKLF